MLSRAEEMAGTVIATSMVMIVITTSNSTNVKPACSLRPFMQFVRDPAKCVVIGGWCLVPSGWCLVSGDCVDRDSMFAVDR